MPWSFPSTWKDTSKGKRGGGVRGGRGVVVG